MAPPGPVVTLVRHGETTWSRTGQHTGRTDLDLTPTGEQQAKAAAAVLGAVAFDLVLTSPLKRARQTAELAGLTPYAIDEDLREWDYGDFEGKTSDEIHVQWPDWSIWDGPWPGGESSADVAARADRVVRQLLRSPTGARVAVVAHGHILRVLAARWLGGEVELGRLLALDTATVSELGWEHDQRVIRRWNLSPA
jgi:broad specificity phosphatase PhoE